MPHFAANLSWLYPDLPFLDRAAAAARDGFSAVECMFPYDQPRDEWARRLSDAGLPLVLINAPCGDWAAGERGLACLPDRGADFRDAILRAQDWAAALGCPRVHVLAGRVPPELPASTAWAVYEERLHEALAATQDSGVMLTIEPINARDMPGYLLSRQSQAHELVTRIGDARLRVQLDLYHCQITEGEVERALSDGLRSGRVGHLQLAGVPRREEPDVGELGPGLPALFRLIDTLSAETGWTGWIGCEYQPRLGAAPGGTTAGLGWLRRWGTSSGD